MKLTRIALVSSFAFAAALGSAFSASDVSYWVGSGSNQAVFVVDYNDGFNPHSYAWGYRWDGSATGADMLNAIDADDSGLFMGLSGSGATAFLDSSTYDANHDSTINHIGGSWPSGWWAYFTKDDETTTWASSWIGMGERQLVNGSWDGWSYVVGTGWDSFPPTEPTAAQAVPEPLTMVGLGIGALGLIARKRR